MSWLFSRALVEASLGVNFSDGTPSAQSNGTHTPQAYCAPDKMTDFSRPSRFGMTFAPLTEDLGADVLTWCLADSLARTSARLGAEPESMAIAADCGPKWREPLARYDRVSRGWRTVQYSLLGDSAEWSETWPKWGMTVDGEFYPQQMPALCTGANASGFWPTPMASEARQGFQDRSRGKKGTQVSLSTAVRLERTGSTQGENLPQVIGGQLNPTWVEWLMGWPLGWTDLQPSATDKYRNVTPLRGVA